MCEEIIFGYNFILRLGGDYMEQEKETCMICGADISPNDSEYYNMGVCESCFKYQYEKF